MATELGIERVLCPRACGVLSALGLAAAAPRYDASSTVMLSGETFTSGGVEHELEGLIERASEELDGPVEHIGVRYELRYRGQSFELTVDEQIDAGNGLGDGPAGPASSVPTSNTPGASQRALRDPVSLCEAFEREHERRYSYRDARAEVELVNVRVSAFGPRPALRLTSAARTPPTSAVTRVVFDGEWVQTQLWRGELPAGMRVRGPALCAMPESTLLVPPAWSGAVDEHGTVVLERGA
jgi:N-methylhydantoinase A